MEIKVRELEADVKEKSKQEIEQELLDKHEQKQKSMKLMLLKHMDVKAVEPEVRS